MEHRISSPSRRAYNFADFVSLPLWDEEGAELKPCLPFMDCEKTEAKRRGRFSEFYDVDESPDDISLINATS
ncbi:unnamed protein product [Anisakis simplex]|uniref:AGC-kinase C-terminal domain-containing protein n=1 Tax=Anisakis simplex TaxID=6269 RepID=A0A0M3KFK5_ANISI|nr:unnamed protein product [Anisakis simplex]